jgi:hypothetical protein
MVFAVVLSTYELDSWRHLAASRMLACRDDASEARDEQKRYPVGA